MAHIFQEMSPGMVTMASTDKNILIYDVLGLKIGIFYRQTSLWTKMSILDLRASRDSCANGAVKMLMFISFIGTHGFQIVWEI